jgi:GntR family transcriptional regulator/MocR family aminotransferase
MQVPILLERRSRVPLHRQIYDRWREGILSGRFAAGTKVPSTRELAAMLSVARATVTTAYDQLTAEGYLESSHGSGTFVSRALPDQPATRIRVAVDPASRPAIRLSRYAVRLESAYGLPDPDLAPGTIDLSKYSPDVDQFPIRVWRRLILRHVKAIASPGWDAADRGAGHEGLRREIAAYLRRVRAVRCDPSQVVVVNGSQQALDLCARVLVDPGDVAAIEDPCYPGARQLFAAHGARLHPVSVERDGIAVPRLPDRARLVFVTPSHQLPTGVSMSLGKRLALLDWARRRGAVVIEDDYDSEYRYGGEPVPALQGLSEAASVVYVGTFSNVMFPGLRIGYLVLPPALVEPVTRARWHADRRSAILEQAALADFLREGHFERHVRRMRRLYGRRREVLTRALADVLGDEVSISCDGVGMFVVVRFSSERVAAQARKQGVRLTSTARYYLGDPPPHEYVLRFSGVGERTLREGVRRLAGVK